jgi:hypothetical protein
MDGNLPWEKPSKTQTDENKMLDKYVTRCGLLQHCAESQLFTNIVMNLQAT